MLDFSNLTETKKGYNGANGGKKSVILNGERYMLKFPPAAKLNKEMSYANSCFSEYLGCQIFNAIGIQAQETLLGKYTINDKVKIVVACKDFCTNGRQLLDFASIKNQVVDSLHGGYGTELSSIIEGIENQTSFDSVELKRYFWDLFIVDALIGNWDRHNGNWGFLYDEKNDTLELAPVYDCGSSLYPQADENIMQAVLSDEAELAFRIKEIPYSAIKQNSKNIRYYEFIHSLENDDCNQALLRVFPMIDMQRIFKIVNETELLTDLQKTFYKTMLVKRYELILKSAYEKIN